MKRILVNMNRSGYFWHELSDVPNADDCSGALVAKMKREISEDSCPSISAMRTYEQYNYVFMKGNGDYILAIRNLNDPRTDGSGRSLKQHVIFEDNDRDLLLKLLAFYLSSPGNFEAWITGECFKPGQNDALCKLVPFHKKIEEIKKCRLDPRLKDCEFAVSSLQSAKWLQEKLQIKGIDIEASLNRLDSLKGEPLLEEPGETDGSHIDVVADGTKEKAQQQETIGQPQQTPTTVPAASNEDEVKLQKQQMTKWKWCAVAAIIAGASVLLLLYKCN